MEKNGHQYIAELKKKKDRKKKKDPMSIFNKKTKKPAKK
jgi:hypothetical protein